MTKLSPAQAQLLNKLKAQKQTYDEWLADSEREFARLKEEKKNTLRQTVAKAIEDNIPVRQIHLTGLGFTQVGSMEKFLAPKVETLSERLARVTQPVTPGENETVQTFVQAKPGLKVRETDNENEWWIADEDGDDWMIHVIPSGGMFVVMNRTDLENAAGPVKEAILAHRPGRVLWGLDNE